MSREGWIGTFIAVVGILISLAASFYFYVASVKEARFAWSAKTVILFNSTGNTDGVQVLDSSKRIIKEDLYATEFSFWNGGNITVDNSLIRKNLSISANGGNEFFDAQISGVVGEEFVRPQIIRAGSSIEIFWSNFDPNTGFKITVIHTIRSCGPTPYKVDGHVVNTPIENDTTAAEREYKYDASLLQLGLSLILIVIAFLQIYTTHKKRKTYGRYRLVAEVVFCALALSIAIGMSTWASMKYFPLLIDKAHFSNSPFNV